ncbi:YqzE family protein [Bacillus sp. 1P06AnD]|uniref:YqzE family protein n=1 Tax=Bacillus sp. 1P06AnD TaxID=3132208 RepID=UPI00399FFC44
MKKNDFITFLTQTIVKYFSQPKDVRHEHRQHKRKQKKHYSTQLFGLVPFALMMFFKGKR